jgi:hypothetical protein
MDYDLTVGRTHGQDRARVIVHPQRDGDSGISLYRATLPVLRNSCLTHYHSFLPSRAFRLSIQASKSVENAGWAVNNARNRSACRLAALRASADGLSFALMTESFALAFSRWACCLCAIDISLS